MKYDYRQLNIGIGFVFPSKLEIELAENLLTADDQLLRDIAKAVLDVTEIAADIRAAMRSGAEIDFEPYLDFWFGDSTDAARQVLSHGDQQDAQNLADLLLAQEETIVSTKELFLREMWSKGIRPVYDDAS